MSDLTLHMDAGTERLLEESLERQQRALDRRERIGNAFFAARFLAVAVAMAVLLDAERTFSPWLAGAFVVALAAVARVELWGGTCYFVPTQIVVVPMLLLLPTPPVPLLVATGLVLARASQALHRRVPAGRSVLRSAEHTS